MNDKLKLWELGQSRITEFCKSNCLELPTIKLVAAQSWKFGFCAYYRMRKPGNAEIVGCLENMARIGVSGGSWSYPGHWVDRTPYGVLAHEIGHHVDCVYGKAARGYASGFSSKLRLASKESPITGYCPNDGEWFAEIVRLFITNPDLLSRIRPRIFAELLNYGLTPVEPRGALDVLAQAPQRTLQQVIKKIRATT